MGWQILYLVSAVTNFLLAFLFYKTRNGALRKVMIAFFLVYGWGLSIRAIWGLLLANEFFKDTNNLFSYLAITPIFLVGLYTAHFLYKNFWGKNIDEED